MKYSQFNSLLKYKGEKFVLYNSFEQKFIFLDERLKEILEQKIEDNIDSLALIHPTFYDYLKDHHFLVDDNCDEVQNVMDVSKQIDENPLIYMLTINPTMNCNFKCWYCYETHVRKSRLNAVISDAIKKLIFKIGENEEIQYFNLSFFGGEPLIYFKDVKPIIDTYLSLCKETDRRPRVSFTTNGYLINDSLIEYFNKKEISLSFQITLDGYKDDHDKIRYSNKAKGSYDVIIRNIRKLIDNNFFVRVRINYTNENIHNCYKIAEDFIETTKEQRQNNFIFDFHGVWQEKFSEDTSMIMMATAKEIRDLGFKTSIKYSFNNVLDSCYADKVNSAVINYNGDVYKCTARDFSHENRVGYLNEDGEIIWNDGYLEIRRNVKFQNKPCLSCKVLPLCNGGCAQHAMDHLEKKSNSYCIFPKDSGEIEKIIETKIDEVIETYNKEE